MTINQILGETKRFFQEEVRQGGELEDMFEWFCSEEGYDMDEEDSRFIYIDRLMNNLFGNLRMVQHGRGEYSLAQEFQDEYESIVEDVEDDYVMYADDYDEIDESEYVEAVAHRLAETLRNPFADTYDYEWYPICQALEAIGISDERGLKKIEGASNGQRLVFAFYALGNDGPLPWAWANYCID